MKFFPMFLRMADRDVVIVGGGETAAQKARLMLKTEARITLVAEALEPELQALVVEGRARQLSEELMETVFPGAALVFVCTGDEARDAEIHAIVRRAGALVNVVDRPDLCEANTPSLVDRDPLVVAIGTEGAAPVLARQIKTRLEEMLEPDLGDLVAFGGRMRDSVAQHVPLAKRRSFWRWVFGETPRRLFASGAQRAAFDRIKDAIAAGGAPDQGEAGQVALVPVGGYAPDLLTLRAVQRLQEADLVICSDAEFAPMLELARRDAARIIVGQDFGTEDWLLSDQRAVAMKAYDTGQRVVWLVARRDAERAALGLPEMLERVPAVRV